MIRRSFRVGLTLGLLGGLAFALVKMLGGRSEAPSDESSGPDAPWPPLRPDQPTAAPVRSVAPAVAAPAPTPPAAAAPAPAQAAKKASKPKLVAAWVEPNGSVCPTSHPVKAKLSSKIFHLPGMLNYDRTNPDRCYKDAPTAEKDGLRPSKR